MMPVSSETISETASVASVMPMAARWRVPRSRLMEGASDSVLNFAYRHAAALIQASAGEGFGLPLIEAGEYGVPLLCSDIPVFHEVAGDHALYFNRENDDLSRLILDFDPDRLPSSEGMGEFTWERAACRVANMLLCGAEWYRELLPDGTAPAAAQGEAAFAVCPEEPAEEAEDPEKPRPVRHAEAGRKATAHRMILVVEGAVRACLRRSAARRGRGRCRP